MENKPIDIPPMLENLDLSRIRGTLLFIGATDVGKSTFAQHIYRRACATSNPVAYLDGDPGQSNLGPPTTITLTMNSAGNGSFPPQGRFWRRFVGDVSPVGHMLPMITGVARLARVGRRAGAQIIIHDTTGLIDPSQGGVYLKLAKIDLLNPKIIFAIQRNQELEYLLEPLRRSERWRLMELRPSPRAERRDASTRQLHRITQFARHFHHASPLTVYWPRLAVFPAPRFTPHRLVALEDVNGFTLGLGIVQEIDHASKKMILQTPLSSLNKVDALRLGDILINPRTFEHQRVSRGDWC